MLKTIDWMVVGSICCVFAFFGFAANLAGILLSLESDGRLGGTFIVVGFISAMVSLVGSAICVKFSDVSRRSRD